MSIPVTVLSGFLGAGKTTTLNHLLQNQSGWRVAVVVNDMGNVNVDANLIRQGGLQRTEENLIELTNGCICCTLRGDLLREVTTLAQGGQFDYILIESSGISETLPIADTFTQPDEAGQSLVGVAHLDTIAVVVDARHFLDEFRSQDEVWQRGWGDDPDDDRAIIDLLVGQVEFADLILLNKIDLTDEATLQRIEALLAKLNPRAEVIRTERGQIPPQKLLNAQRFDYDASLAASEGIPEPHAHHHDHDHGHHHAEDYGITSFLYTARRPFHPARLMTALEGDGLDSVLRSKGLAWIATQTDLVGMWSQAGQVVNLEYAGQWYATFPPEARPDDPALAALMQAPYGDRRQELVIIGLKMDEAAVRGVLDACLLTDAEMSADWSTFEDPFIVL